nr:ornithine cyclodeaminase family protein [Streptomyces palmae]
MPVLDHDTVTGLLGHPGAADALAGALRDGLDPERCPDRSTVQVPAGQLLLMPAAWGPYTGVKIAGVAPGNPAAGLPRITGGYLLLDGPTLQPLALLDGAALTTLRTPAVSALAVRLLATPGSHRLVLFGAGPQARGHLRALRSERPLDRVTVVTRAPEPAESLAAYARTLGMDAGPGTPESVAGADLVVCCTTAREPLFDGRLIGDDTTVVAVGSHEPDARETDTALVRSSAVFVEGRTAALHEAGDLIIPQAEGVIGRDHVAGTLADLVTGRTPVPADRPRLFKSVGMAWEDLVIAAEVYRRWAAGPPGAPA